MTSFATLDQWIFGILLILSSLGIILTSKPVHASLCFLLTLLSLAALYLELSAQFIAVMQILIYAGAILVIFMFVIVLFQDVHQQIHKYQPQSKKAILVGAAAAFAAAFLFLGFHLTSLPTATQALPAEFGSAHSLGRLLYLDFFFPFEAVILIFLVAVVGALYIGRKER
ncbi:putative NADH-ubiquinone/plastoquinone oxidoreductase, chain 6 [Candidatus Protochlamydia naegleriophila]|uniref:NADH-quinone oxidoreductase subunit J n=1 Tax=Candidatus Protochlamydia naegleriophila TaxID=389348 RepID=A0A0U5K5G4_9BACT|nr:NADH-quinone oxidoreductase subunit J [Candidatus Protochlamydia naegleriophila]CUI17355.1 putative NADH-ubiquinone/plastoquinone oxidoreductase, chain 6 [Candidatus Protochlamydia naegleriophila]